MNEESGVAIVTPQEYIEATPQRRLMDRPRTTVKTDRCGICNNHRALTGTGQLYPLAVRGPLRDYVRYICEDCVNLFNTPQWLRVKKLLRRAFRPKRYGIAPKSDPQTNDEKLEAIEYLCAATHKENSATAQQVLAIIRDYDLDPDSLPPRIRDQL